MSLSFYRPIVIQKHEDKDKLPFRKELYLFIFQEDV